MRELQPDTVLRTETSQQWIELGVDWGAGDFTNRRIVSAHLDLNLDVPSGTALELWANSGTETLPWDETGARMVDHWGMDERMGDFVRFNIRPLLVHTLQAERSDLNFFLRVSSQDMGSTELTLNKLSNVKIGISHRPSRGDTP